MGKKDPRVDAYINKSAVFAKPILNQIRKLVHKACPDVEETIKWGFPHFYYKGILCSMAAFKEHASFGFWKASLMKDPDKVIKPVGDTAMGQFGKIKILKDIPSEKVLVKYVKEAMKLNDAGVKVSPKKKKDKTNDLKIPAYFLNALKKNSKAKKTFAEFSYTNKKEYVEWVTEAKTESTREKRLKTAIEWMNEGKIRNWKYIK